MKNKKLLTQQIGYVSTAVDAKEGNLIFEIPIIKTLYEDPIELYGVYNSKDLNNQVFGKNIKMNYYKEFIEYDLGYKVTDAYGNEEEFIFKNNEYINTKTLTKLFVNINILDDESEEITFTLKDKYQNEMIYSDLSNYPIKIRCKDMSDILTSQDFFGFYKLNNEKVTLNNLLNASEVKYIKDNEVMYSTNLEYDTLNRLTKVRNFRNEEVEFEYGSNYIKIKHSLTNSYLKFIFTNNKVTKIESGVLRGNLTPSEILVTYNNDHRKITSREPNTLNGYYEYSSYVFLDNEGRLSYEFDEKGYGYKLEYDNLDNIIFEGNMFNLKTTKNNLILDDGETQAFGQALPIPFNLVGDEQYPLNGELIYQTENLESKENTLSFFTKGTGEIDILVNDVKDKTITATSNYELHQMGIAINEFNKPLTIKFRGNGYIFGVKLQEGVSGTRCEYDSKQNLAKITSNNHEVEYSYNSENKVIQIKENGIITKKISYENNKPNVYKEYAMDVVTEEGLYKRKQITSKGKVLDENMTICNNEYLDSSYNNQKITRNKIGTCSYTTTSKHPDALEKISVSEEEMELFIQENKLYQKYRKANYPLGSKTMKETMRTIVDGKETNYEEYNKLSGEPYPSKYFIKTTNNYNENNHLLTSVFSMRSPVNDLSDARSDNVSYEYYENGLLREVRVGYVLTESFEYYPNTKLLSLHYFNNGEGYVYRYDNKNRLIEIKVCSPELDEDLIEHYYDTGNGFKFEYNDDDLLVRIKKLCDSEESVIEEYIYDDLKLVAVMQGSNESKIITDKITNEGYIINSNGADKLMASSHDSLDYHKKYPVGEENLTYINTEDKTISYSSTTYYNTDKTLNEKYELYPLHKSSVSLKGKKPKESNITLDSFEFDLTKHKKVLKLNNNDKLKYETEYNNGYSAMVNLAVVTPEVLSNLLTLNYNNHEAKIINDEGNIKFKFDNQTFNTNLTITDDKWHKVGVIVDEYEEYDEEENEYRYVKFQILVDDKRHIVSIESYEVIDNVDLTIRNDNSTILLFDMLAISNNTNNTTLLNDYEALNEITTKVETYSSAGLIIREQVYDYNKLIYDKKYNYYYQFLLRSKGYVNTYLLESEEIKISSKNTKTSYVYDETGKVSKITKDSDTVEYTYDESGRLLTAKSDDYNLEYTYSTVGNILKINNTTMSYDEYNNISTVSGSKNYSIYYTSGNNYLPTEYNGNLLDYDGNKLIKFENKSNKVLFEYNQDGLRIKKTVESKTNGSIKQINYYYNDSNLIKEEILENNQIETINYLYDSNNNLFGFEVTNGDRYYYMRDRLLNINGIIDKNKNIVVKYKYDPYGNIISITGNTSLYNPFRYKGYYYDNETGLAMVGQRYYSPELCRFIQPADVSSLNPSSINGLNLYSYANNNPIGIAYSSSNVSRLSSDGMIGSTRGTMGNIVGSGSVGGGSNVSGFGSLGGSSFGGINWPKANSVAMTHYTTSLIKNPFTSWMLGNISYTTTVQLNSAETFYSFSNIGNDGYSVGFGVNLGNWYGSSFYVSSDYGFGTSWQVTPWVTGSYGWSLENGISISGGIIIGDTTHEITVSVGNGALLGYAVCGWVATLPAPGARAVAATAACIIFIVDLFN